MANEKCPFLNLGCGRTHLPGAQPEHHTGVPADIYTEREWINIDRSPNVGADKVFDLFTYPWDLPSDSYDGALLSHLCEHIPHEIKIDQFYLDVLNSTPQKFIVLPDNTMAIRARCLSQLQDGWWAFFAELYRVLTHDARVHILAPHLRSDGAFVDPSHTRHLTPATFTHSMSPDPDAPFEYATGGIHFEMDGNPVYEVTDMFKHLQPTGGEPPDVQQAMNTQLFFEMNTRWNVVRNFYVRLRAVKT